MSSPLATARLFAVPAVALLGCCAASTLNSRTTPEVADAHTVSWEETFSLAADGRRSHRVRQRTVFHTEWAVDNLGDPRITHDTARERLNVVRSETTTRDGKKKAIQPNSINETTPLLLAEAPAYADIRETVVTHVGLERGCTNDFEWEVIAKDPGAPFTVVAPVQLAHTVGRHLVRIEVPADQPLAWHCLACEVTPTDTTEGGRRILTFVWENLQALNLAEVQGKAPVPGQPRLVATTETSWLDLSERMRKLFTAAAKPTAPVRARALSLVENLTTPEQRTTALWRFVVEDLRTVDWPLGDLAFSPSTAAEVLDRSYGHSLDKAVLLSALLASLDIPSRPLLLSRDALFAAEVPALEQFTDIWLIADSGTGERWLSTSALLPGDGVAYASRLTSLDLEVGRPFEVVAAIEAPTENQSRLVGELEVTATGEVIGEFRITLTGSYSPYYAALEFGSAPVGAKQLPATWDTSCDDCWVRVQHWAPQRVDLRARARRRADGGGGVWEVDLPWVPGSQLLAADLHRPSKETTTSLRSPGLESVHFEVRAAEGLELDSTLPQPFLSSSVGFLSASHTAENDLLVLDATVTIEERVLDGDGYLSLRDLATELRRASSRSLLYRKKP